VADDLGERQQQRLLACATSMQCSNQNLRNMKRVSQTAAWSFV
jgi:hypothetical protein